jgi:hypothetical protein
MPFLTYKYRSDFHLLERKTDAAMQKLSEIQSVTERIQEVQHALDLAAKTAAETARAAEITAKEMTEAQLAKTRALTEQLMTPTEREQYTRIKRSLPDGVWNLGKEDIDFCLNGFASPLLETALFDAAIKTPATGPTGAIFEDAKLLGFGVRSTVEIAMEIRLSPDKLESTRLERVLTARQKNERIMDGDLKWARSRWYLIDLLEAYDHRIGWRN